LSAIQSILVTGGAGYVGAVLVPRLLDAGYAVKVIDLYLYGEAALAEVRDHPRLTEVHGDIRDRALLDRIMPGTDAVIHLACISNDPSYELNPALGKSINYDAFLGLVDSAKAAGVQRFIYASSSSVYGIKEVDNVTEDLPLEPLTDYSKYKALCEDYLAEARAPGFVTLVIRPATVCGWSPRLRLDLTVNILTNHAINNGLIKVFGGEQRRPNIHIEDMVAIYLRALEAPDAMIDGKVFNAGYQNHRVRELAEIVKGVVGDVPIEVTPSNDQRSYHISSQRIARELDFVPHHSIEEAVADLVAAFKAGLIPDPMDDARYYNIRLMQSIDLV
jgi:nucleoside-diphosphate-sugar epimerase